MRSVRAGAAALVALGVAASLAACTSADDRASTQPTPSEWSYGSSTSTASASATPAPATFDPKASAAANRAFFDSVNRKTLSGHPTASGKSVTRALVAAGFPSSALEVSASKTSANLEPGSILVAVKLHGQCLIGQWGSAVDGYHSTVAKPLATGKCLVG
ncbi:DUF6993 domain-containing protein [Gryllotalpicola ginsengisoli]|uniref:DUF6993 domain-containing protein n=1 Tax=Gryllotalpicola ginsengisoli TaxID=444608 RepID=UPI00047F4688|nr:hypothetical protein [Gryllotalpicola ginsengisoli]